MKKISVYLLIIMCVFLTGCGNKEKVATTIDTFITTAEGNNFTVTDNMETYKNVDYIVDSKIATLDDIQIEIVKYSDSDSAIKVQNSQIESFALLKNTVAHEEKDKGKNYYRYVLVSNGRYMISSRVDDTLIFSKTLLENKEEVEKVLNSLGY